MDKKGTDEPGGSGNDWFLLEAEECDKILGESSFEELFEKSDSETSLLDLVDNASLASGTEGNHLALFQAQTLQDSDLQVAKLKRKLLDTPEQDLSPVLEKVTITPKRANKAKKQLFPEDSGIDLENEASNIHEETQVEEAPASEEAVAGARADGGGELTVESILKANNRRSLLCGKFKDYMGVSFTELARCFKSSKTCSPYWIAVIFGCRSDIEESARTCLQSSCVFFFVYSLGPVNLFLCEFKASKSRDTLINLFTNLFYCRAETILAEPPRTRSITVALWWYTKLTSKIGVVYGSSPDWIAKQVLLDHQKATEQTFELSEMIQWALDNNFHDESEIAFEYALKATEDANAAAFLRCNNQPILVKNCAIMCRHYTTAMNAKMTMSEYIHKRCQAVGKLEKEEGWRQIIQFLRYQKVGFIAFMVAMKSFLKAKPKKQCICIHGPSNSGKSTFANSIMKFLNGKVISYANANSQFWISPLRDAKVGLLDDVTINCWRHMDIYFRTALDGHPISLDMKHKNLVQMRLCPLMITSNIDISNMDEFKHLASRIVFFEFPKEFPLEKGSPVFELSNETWCSFFRQFWGHLDLSDQEEYSDDGGEPQQSFRVTADKNTGSL
ncbi:early protein E1 [Tadarida brasiliensis papillomavirus 1]|uniref:Replication protein E1 n=1 Tax=Tadarida brasiliensis papillomavirus 1 TaxID=2664215 RepID=A0A5Q2F5U3_9PAPI|nr:early protein E1 [Tadarida brasiliensis papillomavirus 1]